MKLNTAVVSCHYHTVYICLTTILNSTIIRLIKRIYISSLYGYLMSSSTKKMSEIIIKTLNKTVKRGIFIRKPIKISCCLNSEPKAQKQDRAKWNSAIFPLVIYACDDLNDSCEEGLLPHMLLQ